MKVLVLGAGVVGATAAWHLVRDGHEVEVIDRQPAAGLETSFANGGQVSASHATPWATPQTPWKALRWLGHDDAPLVFRAARWDPALWMWMARFLANCTPGRTRANTEKTVRIALYSRDALKALRAELDLHYDAETRGILHIFRETREYDRACASAEVMARAGLPQTILPATAVVQSEPALRSAAPDLVGGILSPDDESGDAHAFTATMARLAAEGGAVFHHGETVLGLDIESGRVIGVRTSHGRRTADAYILSLGSWSPLVARDAGLRLPIYPAKGYSVTVPVTGLAPHVSITDDEHKMVYSRLGDRLRAAGTAELAGWNTTLNRPRALLIRDLAQALFPEAGDYEQAELWCGLRPKTPDSVPYVGPTPLPNLWLNTGHGTLGWTMAVGSARIITDLIGGRTPEIDVSGFGLKR